MVLPIRSPWLWMVAKGMWSYEPPPWPLPRWRLVTVLGQSSMVFTGNWAQFASDMKESLVDQPEKRNEFVRLLCKPHFSVTRWRISSINLQEFTYSLFWVVMIRLNILSSAELVFWQPWRLSWNLNGHPKLVYQFNLFLPNKCQIKVKVKKEVKEQYVWPSFDIHNSRF